MFSWLESFGKAFSRSGITRSGAVQIQRTTTPKALYEDKTKLLFGHTFTDHMLEVDWTKDGGWQDPIIRPFDDLRMHPASSGMHYGLHAFEGMKAFKGDDGKVRLFRPDMNMKRLNSSHYFLQFPTFDEDAMCEAIKELVRMDSHWIPDGDGFSLYIRPTSVSTQSTLGVGAASSIKVIVMLSPVGPYYKSGFAPVNLLADPKYIRAWPGGAGQFKVGGNYATTVRLQSEAQEKKFNQLLWLFGENHTVTEVGVMNQFFYWKKADGTGNELVTAPLSSGIILPGVTRDSVLALAREWNDFEVSEREITMSEVTAAVDSGRMLEAFGTGTAAVVSPVENINYMDKDYPIPLDPSDPEKKIGPLTEAVWKALAGIYYGRVSHPWSVVL